MPSRVTRRSSLLLAVAVLALAACGGGEAGGGGGGGLGQPSPGSGATDATGDAVRIGVVLALSGPVAPLGEDAQRGIQMAVDEINGEGGINGHTLEITTLDSQSEQAVASSAAQRLISQDNVSVLLGGSFGSTANAIGALAEREQVPFITPTGIVVEEQNTWEWTYFTLANFQHVSEALLSYAADRGHERIGLLRLSREYGEIGSRFLNQLAPEHGIEIVAEEQGADGDTDFTSQLTNIRGANPDAMIVWFANPAGAIILQNMQQLGMDLPVMAPLSMANSALVEVGGNAAEETVVQAQLVPAEPLPRQQEFVDKFESQFGELPETFDAVGYDLVQILAEALRSVDDVNDRQALRDALEGVSLEGAGTVVAYSEGHHEPEPEAIVLTQVVDGRFVQAE